MCGCSVRQGEHLEERYAEELERFRHIGVHARHHGSGPLYLLYGTVQRCVAGTRSAVWCTLGCAMCAGFQ